MFWHIVIFDEFLVLFCSKFGEREKSCRSSNPLSVDIKMIQIGVLSEKLCQKYE
ncbi:hypothetical protein LguiB_027390 [Lonicera macranthoides]